MRCGPDDQAAAAAAWAVTAAGAAVMAEMGAGTWVAMVAAMMLPAIVPAVVARRSGLAATAAVVGGYLAVWCAAGIVPLVLLGAAGAFLDGPAGRVAAVATLLVAAAYELTPAKRACLRRCCSGLARSGDWAPALRAGLESGAWCLGCCWALMATLFALGAMSLTWMLLTSAVIAAQKLFPARRTVTFATVAALGALAISLLAAPGLMLAVGGGTGM